MNKIKIVLALFLIAVASITLGIQSTNASMHYFCPSANGLGGWWGTMYPDIRHCNTDYYTWNTNSGISGEESWFKGDAHYIACNYSSFNDPGNVASKVYIPSPDSSQTNNGAHYYKWFNSSNYLAIGSVNQYSVYGWAYLSTVDWSAFDTLKLSDWTNDATKYSKHVDLDEVSFDCYFN